MFPPPCTEARINSHGSTRTCCLDTGHDGDHMDAAGNTWEPPGQTLLRLTARWGRTHRIAWTGKLWLATHRDRRSHWRTEIEPTPELLEASLRKHHGHPPGPPSGHTSRPGSHPGRSTRA